MDLIGGKKWFGSTKRRWTQIPHTRKKKAASKEENYKWIILLYYHNFFDIYYVDYRPNVEVHL